MKHVLIIVNAYGIIIETVPDKKENFSSGALVDATVCRPILLHGYDWMLDAVDSTAQEFASGVNSSTGLCKSCSDAMDPPLHSMIHMVVVIASTTSRVAGSIVED
jgi:hypothetical protein